MQTFVNYIYQFISDLYNAVLNAFNNSTSYNTFIDKQIISGTLINIGMTWRELLLYGATWFLVIFFIVFIFHLVYKLIGLICLR